MEDVKVIRDHRVGFPLDDDFYINKKTIDKILKPFIKEVKEEENEKWESIYLTSSHIR